MPELLPHFLGRLRRWANDHPRTWVLLGLVAFWLCWPGIPPRASASLQNPDTFELLSIDPRSIGYEQQGFHGHPVLGKMIVTDPSVQRRIARSIRWGARLNWVPPPFGAACFSPRHAIRVRHGGSTTDFLICFECRHVQVHDEHSPAYWFDICGFPESTLDEILQKAGIPLASKGH